MLVFIDTNVLLSFYHLSGEDVEELKKLIALIESKEIELLMPSHVCDEFYRNRENKISDALKRLKEVKFNITFPAFCKDFPLYEELRDLIKEANAKHAELFETVSDHAIKRTLDADEIVENIFAKANSIALSDEIYAAARRRVELGNPPGKKGSIGDALSWESLLSAVAETDARDVFIISGDADYSSLLLESDIDPYLENEWDATKDGEVFLFRRISDFFKAKFPAITLASEVEKDLAIQRLARSGSFLATHSAIAELRRHVEFNVPQIEQLASIPAANSQVGWIVADTDIHDFYRGLLVSYGEHIDPDTRKRLEEIVANGEPDESETVLGE